MGIYKVPFLVEKRQYMVYLEVRVEPEKNLYFFAVTEKIELNLMFNVASRQKVDDFFLCYLLLARVYEKLFTEFSLYE